MISTLQFVNLLFSFLKLQATEQGLSTGIKRRSGKGERVIVVGGGGPDGWVHSEVIKRGKTKKNSMNYKDDMSTVFQL